MKKPKYTLDSKEAYDIYKRIVFGADTYSELIALTGKPKNNISEFLRPLKESGLIQLKGKPAKINPLLNGLVSLVMKRWELKETQRSYLFNKIKNGGFIVGWIILSSNNFDELFALLANTKHIDTEALLKNMTPKFI